MNICDNNTFCTRCVGAVGAKRGIREKRMNSKDLNEDKGMDLSDFKEDKKMGSKDSKSDKRTAKLEQMERKKRRLEEQLGVIRKARGMSEEGGREEKNFTFEKTKDQRDIEEEMERLIEAHKNDPPQILENMESSYESQSVVDEVVKPEDACENPITDNFNKSWQELGQKDFDKESENQRQFSTTGGLVDSEDIFAKYSHVLQGINENRNFSNDFNLSESEEEEKREERPEPNLEEDDQLRDGQRLGRKENENGDVMVDDERDVEEVDLVEEEVEEDEDEVMVEQDVEAKSVEEEV